MKTTSRSLIHFLLCISIVIVVSLACNLPGDEAGNLSLSPHADDGSVSGSYQDPKEMGDQKMLFSVTADGFATYHLEGTPESEWLAVGLNDNQTAVISWQGIMLDGYGPLTNEEQAALDELMGGELAAGLEMIPLDIGCQGGDQLDPKQVAALLVPLQMRFKYQVTARSAEAQKLIALSECGYGSWEEGKAEKVSVIQLSPSSPVPAVFGYFPLDEEGGVDPPRSSLKGEHTACLPASTDGGILLGARPIKIDGSGTLPYGPCGARCRGACGSDCTLNNCNEKEELRCEVDDGGQNTGMQVKYKIYECGVHEACIDHDACYDNCNRDFGCDTWRASFCMRGLCDSNVVARHSVVEGTVWAQGFGVKTDRASYEYLDESFEKQPNLEQCPLEDVESSMIDESQTLTDESSSPVESVVDMCTLLPVDESMVINPSKDSCVAEFDALIGCGKCGSKISVTRTESAEIAQQSAEGGRCGNPKFSALGDSPLGDTGITCTNISGEEYREGVAQLYFHIAFSYGRYVASVTTGYPGQEDLVLSLGQEIIDRIDSLDPNPEGQ